MELKRCGNKHFIQSIRGGSVVKVHNIRSLGRRSLSFMNLEDVYKGEDAKTLPQPPTINSGNMHAGSVFDHEHGKCKVPSLPMVDRTLRDIKPEVEDFVWHSDSGLDSDLDDQTTLKQLKERFLKKKRKFSCIDNNSNLAYDDEVPEAEPDLNEPIINLKLKKSKKLNAKKKCRKLSDVFCSTMAFDIKTEQKISSEDCPTVNRELAPVVCVKVELPDADELRCQEEPFFVDVSFIGHNEVNSPVGEASELKEPLLSAEGCLNCVTNEISYDHLEVRKPPSVLLPSHGMNVRLESLELHRDEFQDLPHLIKGKENMNQHCCSSSSDDQSTDGNMCSSLSSSDEFQDLPHLIKGKENMNQHCCSSSSDDQSTDGNMCSRSSRMEEISEHSNSVIQVPDMGINESDFVKCENESKEDIPHEQDNNLSNSDKNHSLSHNSITLLEADDNLVSSEDTVVCEEAPLTCTLNDIARNGKNSESNMDDELLEKQEKQASAFPFTDEESWSPPNNQKFDSDVAVSTSEPHQPPERLLSTRKAISPSSEEQLCLVMNSVELSSDDIDKYKCKELLLESQTGKKVSSVRPDIQHSKTTINHRGGRPVSQKKLFISSRRIIRKSANVKANVDGPRFSLSPHNPSTGCTSIQSCSENAVAFSQRQMQDMETLAMKLINELKSMKDIVEQKMLFEAYRNASLKSDADEVKSAINSATKMEDSAQKWLSMMSRDCNRFCKIMKLTPTDAVTPKNIAPKERRKIMFADEAGGQLCHVKFFENSPMASDDDDTI